MKYESVIFLKNGDISEYSNKDISKKDFFSFLYPKKSFDVTENQNKYEFTIVLSTYKITKVEQTNSENIQQTEEQSPSHLKSFRKAYLSSNA